MKWEPKFESIESILEMIYDLIFLKTWVRLKKVGKE